MSDTQRIRPVLRGVHTHVIRREYNETRRNVTRLYAYAFGIRPWPSGMGISLDATRARGTSMPAHNYPPGWARTRARILARDGRTCGWCGEPATTVDHVVPIARARELGWTEREIHDPSNLIAACQSCNYSRGRRPGPPKRRESTTSALDAIRAGFLPDRHPCPGDGRRPSPGIDGAGRVRWSLGEDGPR